MNFAYLNLKDHPRGNIILQSLINNGLKPSIIIEEESSLAVKNRNSILDYFEETSLFPSTESIAASHQIPVFKVDNHNNQICEALLKEINPSLIVLGDTRIIQGNISKIPKIGIINSHPGYLPDVRGNNPYIWAIIHDLPQGCSIHFIDENVDTGDVILRERINLDLCKSYSQLLIIINSLCAKLMVEAVQQISNNSYSRIPQAHLQYVNDKHISPEFFAAPIEIKKKAINMLEGII
jgi:methionyl-tRNA formyltransferase